MACDWRVLRRELAQFLSTNHLAAGRYRIIHVHPASGTAGGRRATDAKRRGHADATNYSYQWAWFIQFKGARPRRRQDRDSASWAHIVEQPIRHDAVRLALHSDLIIAALGHRRGERVRSLHINTANARADNKALSRLDLTEAVTRRDLETKRFHPRGAIDHFEAVHRLP